MLRLGPDLSPISQMSEMCLDSIKIQDPQSVQILGPAYRFESSCNSYDIDPHLPPKPLGSDGGTCGTDGGGGRCSLQRYSTKSVPARAFMDEFSLT